MKESTSKKLAGIFDLMRTGGSLGQLLIFLEELAIQIELSELDTAEVFIINDTQELFDGIKRSAPVSNITILQTVASAMTCVAKCHDLTTLPVTKARQLIGSTTLWPAPDNLLQGRHNYDSTSAIQDYQRRCGCIPRLSVRNELLKHATRHVQEHAAGALSVAVHLKQNPNIVGQSNANLDAWSTFFNHGQGYPAHFFLIGDEKTNVSFRHLPNVSIIRECGMAIDDDLAIIQACHLFMGMMSGPSNMALFAGKPYIIFKNPDHHVAEMNLEIGENDHYPFALRHQKVLRLWDTSDNLISAFTNATSNLHLP